MNTIAIIENDPDDFKSVKKIFSDTSKQIWPDYHGFWKNVPRNSEEESIRMICKQIEDNIDTLSAIIMDISLDNDDDRWGIKIIQQLRGKMEFKYKLIPIFCYSRHGNDDDYRKEALAAGATNIFNKEIVDNLGIGINQDLAELKISVDSQMLAYQLVQYSLSSFNRVEHYLTEDAKKTDYLVEGLTTLIKIDNLNTITEDKDKEQMLEGVFGGKEKLVEVKRKMIQLEEKYDQVELLDDISGLLSLIPGLNLFSAFPKLISMIRKNTD